MIRSGSKPLSKPRGFESSSAGFFFFLATSSPAPEPDLRFFSFSFSFFFRSASSKPEISSGQSRFSAGSHVLSSLQTRRRDSVSQRPRPLATSLTSPTHAMLRIMWGGKVNSELFLIPARCMIRRRQTLLLTRRERHLWHCRAHQVPLSLDRWSGVLLQTDMAANR